MIHTWSTTFHILTGTLFIGKEIKPVNPKGNQPWIFIGRTGTEAEAPILWPPDAKNWFIGKRPWWWERLKAGRERDDRGWDVGWHHWLNGHEVEQTLRDSEGQGSLVCCHLWGHKESDMISWQNNNQGILCDPLCVSFLKAIFSLALWFRDWCWIVQIHLCKPQKNVLTFIFWYSVLTVKNQTLIPIQRNLYRGST